MFAICKDQGANGDHTQQEIEDGFLLLSFIDIVDLGN